ncbi:precorrin-3B synthase [Paraburkholderia phenoliruptrix]|nr:precorrin-3B synthase [Paraburkholderia phenoliruptrix]
MACSGRRATLTAVSVLNPVCSSAVLPDAALALRPSACPGLVRIVAARDGGICRIKLPGGELGAAQAEAIAHASARHAAGVIELTNRANLQLRGVRGGDEAALTAALVEAGLGPMATAGFDGGADAGAASFPDLGGVSAAGAAGAASAASAASAVSTAGEAGAASTMSTLPAPTALTPSAADDIRNVMISPTAGRDPSALFDTRPLCAALLGLLQSDARFAALSPKFALLVDGGERLARLDHPHDVWLAASQDACGEIRFVFGLAGCPPVNATGQAGALSSVRPAQVAALVRALLHTFLDLAAADATRMRHLLTTHCVDAVLQHAQRYVDFPLQRDAALAQWQRSTAAEPALRVGAHAQRDAGTWHVGGQPFLGRIDASTLQRLAALARQHGNATLHITPWQSVLLPDIGTQAVPAVLAALTRLGFACDASDPAARLIACAGSSGCARSLADTKTDALTLARRLPAAAQVHLSGCPRSCAAAHRAPFTLLAVAPGIYDLYRRNAQPGFGECVARRLTIEQAADALAPLASSEPRHDPDE